MADILAICTAENIPCVPIHDSVICKDKHRGLVYGIMLACYQESTGQSIKLELVAKPEKPVKLVPSPGNGTITEPLFTHKLEII